MEKCKHNEHEWNYSERPIVCKKCGEKHQSIRILDENTVTFSEGYITIKKVCDPWGAFTGIEITTPKASHTSVKIQGHIELTSQKIVSSKPDEYPIFIETWDTLG